jgi:hypothetical protein
MYDHSSFLIVSVLLGILLLAIEVGYRLGRRMADVTDEGPKGQIGAIQASLLGVLALLLGFTFSLSLQRHDSRSQAVIAEANAIGTAMLRAELLPQPLGPRTLDKLKEYVDLRVEGGAISLDNADARSIVLRRTLDVQRQLWQLGTQAVQESPSPVPSGMFVQSLNDMIDAYGSRDSALNRHVPEVVLFLLFGAFALTACLVGYASGVARHRASFPTYVLVLLIVFLVFIIIDLDRPRRGLIEVSQQSLLDLQAAQRE